MAWRGIPLKNCSFPALVSCTFIFLLWGEFPPISRLSPPSWFLFYFRDWIFEITLLRAEGAQTLLLFGASSFPFFLPFSWMPWGRAAESLSPPSLHPQSVLTPPSSTFLLLSLTKLSSQEMATCVNSRNLSWVYVCHFFFAFRNTEDFNVSVHVPC